MKEEQKKIELLQKIAHHLNDCLLYTSDAADE